jgi:hypothetical protein
VAADDHGITVRSDEAPHADRTVTYDQIDRARTVFVWGGADKSAKGPKPKPTAKNTAPKNAGPKKAAPQSNGPSDTPNQEVSA